MADVSRKKVWQIGVYCDLHHPLAKTLQVGGEQSESLKITIFNPHSDSPMDSEKQVKVKFPMWSYLNQPLFHPSFKVMWNPLVFRSAYQRRLLERCVQKESPRNTNSHRR